MSIPLDRHGGARVPPGLLAATTSIALPSNLEPAPPPPQYDQPPLTSGSMYASSMSHERTTLDAYSELESEMNSQGYANMRAGEDDAGSLYTYNSTRDVGQFVKELHGRIFNNLSESYLLPSDQAEWARLDKQGSALAIGFDGLYPCPEIVDAVLLPEGERKRVLDVGCGTGAWAMQMAIKFPQASVLGVDLSPTPIDSAFFPPNLSIEIDDISLGLSQFKGRMDLVHMRCVSGGIRDFDKTRRELELCLKPGGLLLVVDGDGSLLSEDRKTIVPFIRLPGDGGPEITSVSEKGSWLRRFVWEACEACTIAGASLDRSEVLNDLGLWDSPLCDPETARSGGVDFPIGPWATSDDRGETQLLQYVGTLVRQNLGNIHRAFHAIMLKHGMDQATLDEWSVHVDNELETQSPKMWVRFRFYMGRRRVGDGLPAPPLPVLAPPASQGAEKEKQKRGNGLRYPAFDLYHTREENMQRMRQRLSTYGVFPPSVVRGAWARFQQVRAAS